MGPPAPCAMTAEAIVLSLILTGALVLFYTRWIRPDLTALLVMLSQLIPWRRTEDGLAGLLEPADAFAGFGSTAVFMVISMFVVSAALVRTGAAELVGKKLLARTAHNETLLQGVILTSVAIFSSVINDTTAVLIWLPIIVSVCKERNISPSRYLLAVAYGSLLGGQWTLIGTRSNIIVSDVLQAQTGSPLGFFQFTPIALGLFVPSLLFYLVVGIRLLPPSQPDADLAETYRVTEFLTEVMVTPQSDAIGQALGDLSLEEKHGVEVVEIVRGSEHLAPSPWVRLGQGDVLIVQGASSRIARLLKTPSYEVLQELAIDQGTLRSVDLVMVEVVLARQSDLVGRTPADVNLFSEYGLSLLAVSREGQPLGQRPSSIPLRLGDTLLLCGHPGSVDKLRRHRELMVVDSRPFSEWQPMRAAIMGAILAAMVLSIGTGLLHAATALPFAAAATLLTGCLRMRELYSVIDWVAVVVVGGMLSYGHAFEQSGTAGSLASSLAAWLDGTSDIVALGGLLLLALIFAQLVEKTAVALILAPLYASIAVDAGLQTEPVLLGLAMVLSGAFMTPIAHEATILVMGPGRYKFRHYVRVGLGFALITWIGTTLLIAATYDLRP